MPDPCFPEGRAGWRIKLLKAAHWDLMSYKMYWRFYPPAVPSPWLLQCVCVRVCVVHYEHSLLLKLTGVEGPVTFQPWNKLGTTNTFTAEIHTHWHFRSNSCLHFSVIQCLLELAEVRWRGCKRFGFRLPPLHLPTSSSPIKLIRCSSYRCVFWLHLVLLVENVPN